MPPRPHKRSHPNPHQRRNEEPHNRHAGPSQPAIPSSAYVQAYEAQLTYGALDRAESVVSRERGLIQYAGDVDDDREIWADRHDIIHLLPSIPSTPFRPASPTGSSSSWDSLISDVEETFNISGDEDLEAYRLEKRKKWLDGLRAERLREREREEEEDAKERNPRNKWEADEVPSAAVSTLMTHTATSFLSSPNPAILEIRILTNHATDERFAFLKGRWKNAWDRAKAAARRKKEGKRVEEERKKGLGGLGDYASDSEEEDHEDEVSPPPPPPPPPEEDEPPPPPSPPRETEIKLEGDSQRISVAEAPVNDDEEEKRRLRRQRAEEWKRKRAAGQM